MKVLQRRSFIPPTKSEREVDAVVVSLRNVASRLERTSDNLARLVAELREETDGREPEEGEPGQDGS